MAKTKKMKRDVNAVKRSIADRAFLKKKKKDAKKAQEESENNNDSDYYFAFIAGYTSNGTAYGITWEEWEEMEDGSKPPGNEDIKSLPDIF